jgi:hypothetical protein
MEGYYGNNNEVNKVSVSKNMTKWKVNQKWKLV